MQAMDGDPDFAALADLLASSAPPDTPAGILAAVPGLADRLAKLAPNDTVALLAALQTDPRFGSNLVRLEMAVRLVLIHAAGHAPITRDKLFRLLNRDLVDCGVNRLEDPPEDAFLAVAATHRGPYRLFQGLWEKAHAFTEDMLEAFGRLPPSPWGARAFDRAHALLTLSDVIAARAGLSNRTSAEPRSAQKIDLPLDRGLARMMGRCRFRFGEFAELGIDEQDLAPFLFSRDGSGIEEGLPGNTSLERQPLLNEAGGILVMAPQYLSTAVRAHLAERAVAAGAADFLRYLLLEVQSERVTTSGFAHLWNEQARAVDGHPVKQSIQFAAPGRIIHLLQVVDGFDDVPPVAFGGRGDDPALAQVVADCVTRVRTVMRERADFRGGLSIVLLGGWGRAGEIDLPYDGNADWDVIALEPEDAAAIGLVEGGSPMDLWRLSQQWHRVTEQGFTLQGVNGWLNLFGLWQHTKGTLIPEHYIDCQPPVVLAYPSDMLLAIRDDATQRLGRHALALPSGRVEIVSRLDRSDIFASNKPSFVALPWVRRDEMLGVVVGRRNVWLSIQIDRASDRSFDTHETWRAAIHWLEEALPTFDAAYPNLGQAPIEIRMEIEWPADRTHVQVDNDAIERSIGLQIDPTTRTAVLSLSADWQHGLHRRDNYAELWLAACLLSAVSALCGGDIGTDVLLSLMQRIVGSDDIRWRHSFLADRPLPMLQAHGLISEFSEIPMSASALARCGSTFITRPRNDGPDIQGADACFGFLMAHHMNLLDRLLAAVRPFDRTTLVTAAVSRLVGALAEDQTWTLSARALRAIYGTEKDFERSLERRNEINAVIRGASILAEIAACEARPTGGQTPGTPDLDELMAECLQLFQTAELVPPMRGGLITPHLQISPTGDILYNHDFQSRALTPSVHARHSEQRASADRSYRTHFERDDEIATLEPAFKTAVSAEFGIEFDAFTGLSGACTELAVGVGKAELILPRSELVQALGALPRYQEMDVGSVIDRLTLTARNGWRALPPTTSSSDFDVSRFDRHFSLIGRPILGLTSGDDPLLLVSPPLIERAALHNLAGAREGSLQGRFWSSAAMRKFVGSAAEKAGLAFNDRVAEQVRVLGLDAYASVKLSDALHHKGTDAVKQLGDIDVLAFSKDRRHAWVIEAKDIRFCRNLSETTTRLAEYRGELDSKGKLDKLRKHLNRADYVRRHAEDLAKRYRLPAVPTLHGLVVFDSPQPMAFMPSHPSIDAQFTMLTNLDTIEWAAR